MAVYIDKFVIPQGDHESENIFDSTGKYIGAHYPADLFPAKLLKQVDFDRITIFYGGNGSGKTTLLNLIAENLDLIRISPFNSSKSFKSYAKFCKAEMGYGDYGEKLRVPNGSKIICSDDIFEYMLNIRENNQDIAQSREEAVNDFIQKRYYDTVKLKGMAYYEEYRLQVLARKKKMSANKFSKLTAGEELKLDSNGETALRYFYVNLENDKLYLLDEPENSLSPKKQLELIKHIAELARYCGCQFVIATHSPFILSIDGAKIYDLDAYPVDIKNWWELENPKAYFEFFNSHKDKFLKK